jgi:hypothetical protein
MAKLRKFDLVHDKVKDDWALKNRESGRTVKRFENKSEGTKGGVLSGAIGQQGGSVVIRKMDGKIQEERTFPGSADPKGSPG